MERRQSTVNFGTGDSPVRELDKKMENAIEKEYISISQNQSSIKTNREEINDLKNRMKNLEELLGKQQEIINRLSNNVNNDDRSGIYTTTPSVATIGTSFTTSKGTTRKYTAQEHKEMMDHLTNLHQNGGQG